jgi:transcription elongation factor GreA
MKNNVIKHTPKPVRFTKAGYEKLQAEYEALKAQRPAVVEDVKKAREMGDLSENGYYKASKAKLSFIDGQLRRLKFSLKQAVIITDAVTGKVGIGSKVKLTNGEREYQFEIVGDLEANPSEKKISLLSPLGKSLAGKKVGEVAEIVTPMKTTTYKILEITS